MHGEVGQHQRQHQGQHAQSGQYVGYDSMVPRSAAAEYHGTVNPGLLPSQQQMYMYASPAAFPPQPAAISEQMQHFTAQTASLAAAMESLESTRVFIMDLFRQVNLAWVPEATVQEILGNRELVEQIQRFRAVGMPLELLVNYLKQCLQLVNPQQTVDHCFMLGPKLVDKSAETSPVYVEELVNCRLKRRCQPTTYLYSNSTECGACKGLLTPKQITHRASNMRNWKKLSAASIIIAANQ
ncbi:hypothetical protein Bbelb_347270 [Branchiostoma belcheri]|nr:hypothetical protein Bbelb_347270 [Branchiostoma belcheri]